MREREYGDDKATISSWFRFFFRVEKTQEKFNKPINPLNFFNELLRENRRKWGN